MTAEEFYKYKMDAEERAEWKRLKSQIYEDCKKAGVPEKFMRYADDALADDYERKTGYCRTEGFYYIFTERGYYKTEYSGDEKGMRFFLLENIFGSIGTRIELENRDRLAKEWKCYEKTVKILKPPVVSIAKAVTKTVRHKKYVYGVEYDSRKFWFEYTINAIDKTLGEEFSLPLAEKYTKLMNRRFDTEHWFFDGKTRKFTEK
ncbi:MAG: hypothetical protein NC192_08785 [Muribaculaceae bacterium]|nr:hypothetical protein [Muribaculaceae bacterium]